MGIPSASPKASAIDLTSSAELDLSVIIVNYNVREFLEQALRSVFRAGKNINMEVFVVDNSSVDGSVSMVRSQFPDVNVIANDSNVGFSRANNQAIRRARGRYILILNPDTIVQEDTLDTLVAFMDSHPRAGAAGCKILHPNGTFARESRRAFPTPRVAFYRLVGLSSLFPSSRRFGRYNMTYLPENETAEVDALSGSCMMVRREALEGKDGAGLLDEAFFMYGEDLDWCYRIQQAGWKILYTPDTQIIHYKGESTKKGELRYVRLFYGAMMRFTEKHFENRYSGVVAALLRLGILFRALASVLGKAARALAWPALDFLAVYATASFVAFLYSASHGATPAALFFLAVAPAYGLASVAGIGACGGYGRRKRIRCVWFGVFVGLVVVASLSFFAKNIAFSRIVILLTYPTASAAASLVRMIWAKRAKRTPHPIKAILVGRHDEAVRLRQMLARHPSPPFKLSGYVAASASLPRNGHDADNETPLLGSIKQLRDIVRLGNVDDVIFASAALSNRTIFRLIQQLRDLPVHFRILAEGRDHVIGKASVDDLSMTNVVEVEEALIHTRSRAAQRTFDLLIAFAGIIVHPFLAALAAGAGKDSFARRLVERTRRLPDVIRGTNSIVGYDPDGPHQPPAEWNLKPGVFAVAEVLDFDTVGSDEVGAAYWFYVRNQSGSLDWDIVIRSLRLLRKRANGRKAGQRTDGREEKQRTASREEGQRTAGREKPAERRQPRGAAGRGRP